jgi:release factor glutamine methyltransferase
VREPLAPPPLATAPGPGERWTILRLILWSAGYLGERGVPQARLDAEHLLAHALGVKRLALYLQHDRPLDDDELARYKPLLLRRSTREPLQYVIGHAAFRELELICDRRALIPRPETEVLVQVVLDWARKCAEPGRRLSAADVGTGTGCIALSLAHEGPFDQVVATDVSTDALALAAENSRTVAAGGKIQLRRGDLLAPLAGDRFDVLVSNPPYVASVEQTAMQREVVEHEPWSALFAGEDGLALLRALVNGAPQHLTSGGLFAVEVGAGQAGEVAELVKRTDGLEGVRVHRDLAGKERIVTAVRNSAA